MERYTRCRLLCQLIQLRIDGSSRPITLEGVVCPLITVFYHFIIDTIISSILRSYRRLISKVQKNEENLLTLRKETINQFSTQLTYLGG